MPFKLVSSGGRDVPVLVCEVCQKPIVNCWQDLASAVRGTLQAPGAVLVHHKACPVPNEYKLHLPIAEFSALFAVRNNLGDVSSDGKTSRVIQAAPAAGGFEA